MENIMKQFEVIKNAIKKTQVEKFVEDKFDIDQQDDHDCKLGVEKGCETCEKNFWEGEEKEPENDMTGATEGER